MRSAFCRGVPRAECATELRELVAYHSRGSLIRGGHGFDSWFLVQEDVLFLCGVAKIKRKSSLSEHVAKINWDEHFNLFVH